MNHIFILIKLKSTWQLKNQHQLQNKTKWRFLFPKTKTVGLVYCTSSDDLLRINTHCSERGELLSTADVVAEAASAYVGLWSQSIGRSSLKKKLVSVAKWWKVTKTHLLLSLVKYCLFRLNQSNFWGSMLTKLNWTIHIEVVCKKYDDWIFYDGKTCLFYAFKNLVKNFVTWKRLNLFIMPPLNYINISKLDYVYIGSYIN